MKRKNSFLTFIFSFIPGAGQMYQGAMKRGLSLMTIFCLSIMFMVFVSTPIFAVPIIIVLAYSFFDTFHIHALSDQGLSEYKDEYIWNEPEFKKVKNKDKSSKVLKTFGIILIVIGVFIFFNSFVLRLLGNIDNGVAQAISSVISRYAPGVIASVLAVFVGIKLITKDKKED